MDHQERINEMIIRTTTHNIIINEETQPTDGFRITLFEGDDELEYFDYDHSWDEADAIQDALSGV
jgi:hypothetical protein